jgi:hypothetical protein
MQEVAPGSVVVDLDGAFDAVVDGIGNVDADGPI